MRGRRALFSILPCFQLATLELAGQVARRVTCNLLKTRCLNHFHFHHFQPFAPDLKGRISPP